MLTFFSSIINLAVLVIFFIGMLLQAQKEFSLGFRILTSLLLGIAFGYLMSYFPQSWSANFNHQVLFFVGHAYLALLKMLVIPLIFTSIIHAIISMKAQNETILKRISFFSCFFLLLMTAISSFIGIVIANFFNVGAGFVLPDIQQTPQHVYSGLTDTLLAMLPSNPIGVMAQENTIAVVVFAVLIALAAHRIEKSDPEKFAFFEKMISSLFTIVKKLASLVLSITPYGIFSLISLLLMEQGVNVFKQMFNYIFAMYVAMAIVLLMHLFLLALFKYNPWSYLKKASTALFVAFTTRSSFGTLPVTEEILRERFSIPQIISSFTPSIGATIGMNACAGVFPAMLVAMTMTMMHQPIDLHFIFIVMLINTVASLGISGIPGAAYIAATVTLTSLGLPYSVVALVQGVDPIIDMGRTAINVNGVLTTAIMVHELNPLESHQPAVNAREVTSTIKI